MTETRQHGIRRLWQRTIGGLAAKLGWERHWVIGALVVLALINFPLAVAAFAAAYVWVEQPPWTRRAARTLRRATRSRPGRTDRTDRSPHHGAAAADDDDPWLDELTAKFADLEARTAAMETHVTSREFDLNREFNKMKKS